jgi:hypothetical protein
MFFAVKKKIFFFRTIFMARLGIIESSKLLSVLENVSKKEKFVYTPNVSNLVKLEQTITIEAYYKENKITYLLEIPIVYGDTYVYYKLTPLPVLSRDCFIPFSERVENKITKPIMSRDRRSLLSMS